MGLEWQVYYALVLILFLLGNSLYKRHTATSIVQNMKTTDDLHLWDHKAGEKLKGRWLEAKLKVSWKRTLFPNRNDKQFQTRF